MSKPSFTDEDNNSRRSIMAEKSNYGVFHSSSEQVDANDERSSNVNIGARISANVPSHKSIAIDYIENEDDGNLKTNSKYSLHKSAADNKSKGSRSYLSGSSHSSDSNGVGKEIADVGFAKVNFMRYLLFSAGLHSLYIIIFSLLNQPSGFVLPFNPDSFLFAGGPITFALAMVCFFLNELAMKDAFAAGAGYLLSRPEGYSIAVCGFNHASTFEKMIYPWRLSNKTGVKWVLVGCSAVYGMHSLVLPLTFVASMGISTALSRMDSTTQLMCLTYSQKNSNGIISLKDRGVPTLINEMGVAELMDGSALGSLRISNSALTNTTIYLPPQLTDVCQDGSTIIGNGFKTDILSSCTCSADSSASSFTSAGFTLGTDASSVAANASLLTTAAMANYATYSNRVITLTTAILGTQACASKGPKSVPICTTQISNHQIAKLLVSYKTDGTTASIAAKTVSLVSIKEDADMVTLFGAIKNQIGSSAKITAMPATFAVSNWTTVNPMLWMMTNNSRDIQSDLTILGPGMEYIAALIIRSSIQRSYLVTGGFCVQNVVNTDTVTLFVTAWSYSVAVAWFTFQALVIVGCLILYIPWFITDVPIYPAIQVCVDPILFTCVACKNATANNRIKWFKSNVESAGVWRRLDVVMRVGESVLSAEDPERGVIVIDKPDMVTEMSYSKTYV